MACLVLRPWWSVESIARQLVVVAILGLMGLTSSTAQELVLRVEAQHHTATIRRLAVSADGQRLATVSDDKTARLWRLPDGRLLATLRVPVGHGDVGRLSAVAFSPDGLRLAVSGVNGAPDATHTIDVFDAENGTHLKTLQLDGGQVVRLLWSRNGEHLAACLSGRNGLRIMGVDGRLQMARDFGFACYGLAELPDGSLLVSVFDGRILHYRPGADGVWTEVGSMATDVINPQALALSPDGSRLAVGYRSGLPSGGVAVDVFDVNGRRLERRFTFSDLQQGALGSVAWSADGRTIAAGGRATHGDRRHVLKRISWPQGEVRSDLVSTNTIQDMVPIGPDGFAVASSNGNWGLVPATGALPVLGSPIYDLAGADSLKADERALRISFGADGPHGPASFDLPSRALTSGVAEGVSTAKRFSFSLSVADWQNGFSPRVAGRAVAMEPSELSRAYALLSDGGLALATDRRLRRFDATGAERWSVRASTEVMAVTTSADSRVIVGSQLDGTIRWWRASDGALLLSLFVTLDGRWVLWTEQGYYDAGAGAESLIGWHLNRSPKRGVDYFSVGRFRDKYHRPDVIDRLLQTWDPAQALELADSSAKSRVEVNALPPLALDSPSLPTLLHPDPLEQRLPPVLSVLTERSLRSSERLLRVQFSLRAGYRPAESVQVRLDGRPVELRSLRMPTQQDGVAIGQLSVEMPAVNAELAVMAKAGELVSEPVFLSWSFHPPSPAPSALSRVDHAQPSQPSAAMVGTPAGQPPGQAMASIQRPAGESSGNAAATNPPGTGSRPARSTESVRSRLFVVSVGVSHYARKDYELRLAAKDATDFSHLMRAQQGRLYSSVEQRLLTDRNATRAAVLEALQWLRRSVGPGDTGMLFLAGHGVSDGAGRYHFLTHEGDADHLSRTAVGEQEIRQALSNLKGRALMFADTCYSGNVIGTGAAVGREIGRLANTLSSSENGVIVFSASTGRQESYEHVRWSNGAFTKALIDGLQGGADFGKDGVVTHQGLSYFLGREVRKLTKGAQTPVTAVPLGVVDFPMVSLLAEAANAGTSSLR